MMFVLHLLFAMHLLQDAHGHAYVSWPASRNFDDCNNFEPQSVNNHCDNCNTQTCGVYSGTDYANVVHPPAGGSFVAGGLLEVETIVTAHHKGYMELRICSRPDDLNQDCFDEHLLVRDSESVAIDPAPVDESHPGRWYIPPPQVDWSPDAISVPTSNACSRSKSGTRYRWTVRLPSDLECEHCVVQWFWVTANSCNPVGLHEYYSKSSTQSWITSKFGGDASAWWKPLLASCPADVVDPRTNNNGAEKFWNCADIKVVRCSGSSCTTAVPSSSTTTSILSDPTSTGAATSTFTTSLAPASTTGTTSATQCFDSTLPSAWSGGGVHTCQTYEQLGLAYCDHAELNAACCFCGGGQPEPEPEPEPLPCTDAALPSAWSGGGAHTCSTYEQHGGSRQCAHQELKVACCFCGGGSLV